MSRATRSSQRARAVGEAEEATKQNLHLYTYLKLPKQYWRTENENLVGRADEKGEKEILSLWLCLPACLHIDTYPFQTIPA